LYHWIDFPSASREAEILMVRAPEVPEELARKVANAVQKLRQLDLAKKPGIAESIDWARAIAYLGERNLTREIAEDTLGSVVKEHDDLELVRNNLSDVLR
ncbi:MAG: AAA family ATPase, partial [Actinomycetota bacterium]